MSNCDTHLLCQMKAKYLSWNTFEFHRTLLQIISLYRHEARKVINPFRSTVQSTCKFAKKPSSRSFHAKVKISMFGLHANPEKISKADLSHIVRNVLVIHQSSTVASVLWLNGRIGLKNGQHCKMVKSLLLTILIPFKDGWTHSASFQAFGPILPCPQLDRSISMVLVV